MGRGYEDEAQVSFCYVPCFSSFCFYLQRRCRTHQTPPPGMWWGTRKISTATRICAMSPLISHPTPETGSDQTNGKADEQRQRRHSTYAQPHEPLLVGWIAGADGGADVLNRPPRPLLSTREAGFPH
jgi:hypothetical protein